MYRLELNRDIYRFEKLRSIEEVLYKRYPNAVMYSDDGFMPSSDKEFEDATKDGRRVLIWASEAESENDDGSRAIGTLTRN